MVFGERWRRKAQWWPSARRQVSSSSPGEVTWGGAAGQQARCPEGRDQLLSGSVVELLFAWHEFFVMVGGAEHAAWAHVARSARGLGQLYGRDLQLASKAVCPMGTKGVPERRY